MNEELGLSSFFTKRFSTKPRFKLKLRVLESFDPHDKIPQTIYGEYCPYKGMG